MPQQGWHAKHQLRGTGYRDGLRSNSTMKDVGARVQREILIGVIREGRGMEWGRPASPRGAAGDSPLDDAATPLK
jgi:hypothetical protein